MAWTWKREGRFNIRQHVVTDGRERGGHVTKSVRNINLTFQGHNTHYKKHDLAPSKTCELFYNELSTLSI